MARINRSELHNLQNIIADQVEEVAYQVTEAIRAFQPNDTGMTRSLWTFRVRGQGSTKVVATISNPSDVAAWLHTGTGIYGPIGRPITPVTADFLRFKPKGASQFIFRRSVRGMPPNDYIIDGIEAASPWPVTVHSRPGQAIPRGR